MVIEDNIMADKFVVTRDVDNEYILTIKQDGSTLPMEIVGTDTFVATLVKLSDGTEVALSPVVVDNAAGGRIKVVIGKTIANTLEADKAGKEDRYYLRPTYKLIIEANTANNGKFIAKVHEVYVD